MIVVEQPGLRTTVQDLGRPGFAHLGVPASGAADLFSASLANALVGNSDDAAVLETTLVGPTLRFEHDTVIALAGAPAKTDIDGAAVAPGRAISIRAGQLLRIGRAVIGLRTYLAVSGGFGLPQVLGSRSTDTLSGLGPAALAAGDVLTLAQEPVQCVGRAATASVLESVLPRRAVRVVFGPDAEWFADSARNALCSSAFSVSARSDRIGVRLDGTSIERAATAEAPTAGMVRGAIQVPPDAAPIVLLADHAVTGGYPVIAVAATADLPMIAQCRPGDRVSFAAVSVAHARAALGEQRAVLNALRSTR